MTFLCCNHIDAIEVASSNQDWGVYIVAGIGVLISTISLYIVYRARSSNLRHELFKAQITAYMEITETMTNAGLYIIVCYNSHKSKDEEGFKEYKNKFVDERLLYFQTLTKWRFVLTSEVLDTINLHVDVVEECSTYLHGISSVKDEIDPEKISDNTVDEIGDTLRNTINKMRESLGTEPLSKESQHLYNPKV